jgi:hypothetical protein
MLLVLCERNGSILCKLVNSSKITACYQRSRTYNGITFLQRIKQHYYCIILVVLTSFNFVSTLHQTSQRRRYMFWRRLVRSRLVLGHAGYESRQLRFHSYLLSCCGPMLVTRKDSNAGSRCNSWHSCAACFALVASTTIDVPSLENVALGYYFYWI